MAILVALALAIGIGLASALLDGNLPMVPLIGWDAVLLVRQVDRVRAAQRQDIRDRLARAIGRSMLARAAT
jgi:hypothetical protein